MPGYNQTVITDHDSTYMYIYIATDDVYQVITKLISLIVNKINTLHKKRLTTG